MQSNIITGISNITLDTSTTTSGSRKNADSVVIRLCFRRPLNSDSIPVNNKKYTSSPKRPNVFWGPYSVLTYGYRKLFPWQQRDLQVNILVLGLRTEAYLHSPRCVMVCLRTTLQLFYCPQFHRFQIEICIINPKVIISQV